MKGGRRNINNYNMGLFFTKNVTKSRGDGEHFTKKGTEDMRYKKTSEKTVLSTVGKIGLGILAIAGAVIAAPVILPAKLLKK